MPLKLKPRTLPRGLRSDAGVTIVEGIVALGVIMIVAFATASFFTQQQATLRGFGPGGECKAVLQAQMGYLRQLGSTPWGLPWTDAMVPSQPLLAPAGYDDAWLTNPARFGSLMNAASHRLVGTGPYPAINSTSLQRGAIGTLNTLYNYADPNLCNHPDGIDISSIPQRAGAILFPVFDRQTLKNFRTNIRISSFDANSGADLGCPARPFWIRPRSVPPENAQLPVPYSAISGVTDRGYRVQLVGTYADLNDSPRSCELSEEFHYPVDKGAQSIAYVLSARDPSIRTGNFSPPNAVPLPAPAPAYSTRRPQCSHAPSNTAATLRLEIGFRDPASATPVTLTEQGTVFLCRDVSVQMNPDYCVNNPSNPSDPGVPGAGMRGNPYNTAVAPANPPWVPCRKSRLAVSRRRRTRIRATVMS